MSAARDIKGPWLNADVLGRVPHVQRQFDLNRDPHIARQIADLGKTEKQRRDESTGKQDKPAPALKPPRHLRGNADREGWLTAHRDAVLTRAAARDATREAAPERAPEHGQTQPGLTRGP